MPSPLVAVGVPVYNGEKWLRFTVESILRQSFSDLEVVIVDNASTDSTPDVAAELQSLDKRVRFLRNPSNLGVFRNYDAAFQSTASRYFKWCPVGDCCDESFIGKAVDILEDASDVVLVHARTGLIGDPPDHAERFLAELNLVDDDPATRFREYLNKVRLNNIMNGLIRSDELRRTCLNKPFHASDKCMIAELALRGKMVELPEELLFRRMEQETATALKSEADRQRFFAGEPSSPSVMWHWKCEATLFKGILGSPLSRSQKFHLTPYMMKRLLWQRVPLIDDLLRYLRLR